MSIESVYIDSGIECQSVLHCGPSGGGQGPVGPKFKIVIFWSYCALQYLTEPVLTYFGLRMRISGLFITSKSANLRKFGKIIIFSMFESIFWQLIFIRLGSPGYEASVASNTQHFQHFWDPKSGAFRGVLKKGVFLGLNSPPVSLVGSYFLNGYRQLYETF